MADIQSNINIGIDTTSAIASIKNLQREISAFHQNLRASGSAANAAISDNMAKNLINSVNATKKFSASLATVNSTTEAFTTSLEKNKFSMGQYFKFAAGSTKTFGKLFKTEFDTIQKVAESRVRTLQTQFIKLGKNANGSINAIKVRPLALDMDNLATKTAIAAQKQQLMNQLIKQGSTNLLNFGKNTQWAGRQLMVGFTVPLTMLGSTAAKVFMEMEKEIIKLKRVYGDFTTTAAETEQMVNQIKQLGNEFTKYGVAVSKTMGLAADAAAMGKTGADLLAQVEQANKLAVLGGVDQAQALETTISVTNAFGVAADKLSGKIDFLNAVENQTVTSIEDLTVAIPKAGPVIQQLGGNVEDLAFFLTAMKEGGINASEGANALKSGLASMINPTKKASDFLASFGVNLKGIVEANKGDIKGTVIGFAKALDTLDPLNRARAIEQLFGKFQFARISTLFKNVVSEGSQASRVLGLTKATSAELAILSEREMKKVEDSPMFKFQKAIEDIKAKLVPLGEAFLKLITPVVEFATKMLDQFNSMGDGVKNFIMGTIAVLGGLAPAAIMAFGLIANGIANLIKAGNFLKNVFLNAGKGTSILGQQTQYMSSEQLEAAAAAASLDQAHQNLTQQFTAEESAVRKLIAAYNDAAVAGARLGGVQPVGRTRPVVKKADGGAIYGPGTGTSDSIPAMLSNGEYVIKASSAKKLGTPFLDSLNKYATGGAVRKFSEGGSATSSTGRSIDVGGNTYIFGRDFDLKELEKLKTAAEHLHNVDPDIARATLLSLESEKIAAKDSIIRAFGRKAILWDAGLSGRSVGETLKNIFPEAEYAGNNGLREDLRSKLRGNQTGTTVLDEVKNNPKLKKEFELARGMAKAHYEAIISAEGDAAEYWKDKVKDKQKQYDKEFADGKTAQRKVATLKSIAEATTGYSPDSPNSKHGTERGHLLTAGALKQDKRLWGGDFVAIDPRMENNMLSTLSRDNDGARTKIVFAAADEISKKNPELSSTIASLKEKIQENAAFSEEERIAFAKITKEISTNGSKYKTFVPKGKLKDFGTFFENLRLLSSGYDSVGIEKPQARGYRTNTPESTKAAVKDVVGKVKSEMAVILNKVNVGKGMPRTLRFLGFNKGVVSVPGPKGAGDVVPAMLSPGESVIPAGMSKKYAPLISGMVDGTLPGYAKGKKGFRFGADYKGTQGLPVEVPVKIDAPKIGAQISSTFMSKLSNFGTKLGDMAGISLLKAQNRANGILDKIDQRRAKVSPEERAAKKEQRLARSGRMAQAGMGLSMAVGMASALPGGIGKAAQAAIGPISAATAAMSLIPGPWGIAAGVIAGAGAAIWQAKEQFEAFRAESAKTAKAVSSGTEAMKSLSEFAGSVSPSETMARIRADESSLYNIKTGKDSFGGSYLQSEQGSAMLAGIRQTSILSGQDVSVSDIATQLSQAVATNVLTKEQAASIAYNLGAELKDYDFSANVLAKMTEIIGPNGEDLTNQPLEVAARIVQEKQTSLGAAGDIGSVKGLISEDQWGMGIWNTVRANYTEVAAAETKYAQGFSDILDMGQQNLDNLELAHRARLDELTAANDLKGIDAENSKYLQDRADLQKDNAAAAKEEFDYISGLAKGSANQIASAKQIVENIGSNKKKLFEGMDDSVKNVANTTIDNITSNKTLGYATRATLTANISVENVDDYEKLQTLFPVKDYEQTWTKIAQVGVKYGSGAQEQIVKLGGVFGKDEQATYDVFVEYVTNNEDGQQVMNDLTEITRATKTLKGTPVKMSELIDTKTGAPTKKMQDITAGINKVAKAIKDNKGKSIKYSFQTVGFKLTKDQADYFNSLPPDQQKVYTTTYLTIQKTMTADQITAYRNKKIAAAGGTGVAADYWRNVDQQVIIDDASGAESQARTEKAANTDVKDPNATDPNNNGGGGSNPLDDLLKKLKNIRQAAVNASGGMAELMKWMKRPTKNMPGPLEKKSGGLVFNGIEQQLGKKNYNQDFIDFIANADKDVQKKFVKISKNGAVTLKKEGVALQNLFNALKIGDYERSVANVVKSTQTELSARKELLATGMSYKDAVEAGRDSGLAEAIAAIKASTNIKDKNKAIADTIALYKQQKQAAEDAKTPEEKFNDALDKINKKLDADRNKINLDFEVKVSGDKTAVKAAQDEIEGIRYQIDDYNAGLTRLQPLEDAINKKYDDRRDALDKIREINDRIANQQKAQLTLADALSQGDISAAAKQVQDMRAQNTQDALDMQQKQLDAAREEELAGLKTSVNGVMMTRSEIEAKVKDLETQIFEIEESRLEPANERIRLAEIERDKKLAALDAEKLKWDILQNSIALAATAATNYADELARANTLAAAAVEAYNPKKEEPKKDDSKVDTTNEDKKFDNIKAKIQAEDDKAAEAYNNSKAAFVASGMSVSQYIKYVDSKAVTPDQSAAMFKNSGLSLAQYMRGKAYGGPINYRANGGALFPAIGTDTIPAMLTPGEFIISKSAVENFGVNNLRSINNGTYGGNSLYNYEVNVNVKSDANPDQIARAVITQIKQVESQSIRRSTI